MAAHDTGTLHYGCFEPESLLAEVDRHGWIVVAGVPCWIGNTELLNLASYLGPAHRYGPNLGDAAREGEPVHRVASFAEPNVDLAGKQVLSTTSVTFDLHTDDVFHEKPSRYVLLHCWRADPAGGGITMLADSEAALARLDPAEAEACFSVDFRWRFGTGPVLTRAADRAWPLVRFNRREMNCATGDASTEKRLTGVIESFARASSAAAHRIALQPGDCLIIDNRRVLHGRTEFAKDSPRLLKRVRVLDAKPAD